MPGVRHTVMYLEGVQRACRPQCGSDSWEERAERISMERAPARGPHFFLRCILERERESRCNFKSMFREGLRKMPLNKDWRT